MKLLLPKGQLSWKLEYYLFFSFVSFCVNILGSCHCCLIWTEWLPIIDIFSNNPILYIKNEANQDILGFFYQLYWLCMWNIGYFSFSLQCNSTVNSYGIIFLTYQLNLKYCCKCGMFMDAYKCNKPAYWLSSQVLELPGCFNF